MTDPMTPAPAWTRPCEHAGRGINHLASAAAVAHPRLRADRVPLAADPEVPAGRDAPALRRLLGGRGTGVVAVVADVDRIRRRVVVARLAARLALRADPDPHARLQALAPRGAGVVHLRAVLAGRAVVVDVELADLLAAHHQVL